MIIKKVWIERKTFKSTGEWQREGWYLFGIIPLYIRDSGPRERRVPTPEGGYYADDS